MGWVAAHPGDIAVGPDQHGSGSRDRAKDRKLPRPIISPGTTPPPGSTPTTTSPTSTPAPTTSPNSTTRKNTVVIKGTSGDGYRFSPRRLRTRRGKRITWTWNSNAPHNVVFRRPRKRSKTADQGEFKLRFRKRGTYRYLCTVHDFGGKIVVR